MRKELDIKDRFHSFAACSKCHKLYKQQVVENFREDGVSVVMKCQHVEYPNSTKHRENRCQTALTQKTKMLNSQISYKPILTYLFVSIQQQLAVMFRRPGFEKSLRHWANRSEFDNTLTDIYDGQVWKNFKDTTVENSPLFFRSKVADSHLGLMLNLDWFIVQEQYMRQFVICHVIFDLDVKTYYFLVYYLGRTKLVYIKLITI
jgi:hypothetical protein